MIDTDPYAEAPIIEIHTENVLDLIASHISYEPSHDEYVAMDLARAALLDRLALLHTADHVAQHRAHVAAAALITRLDAETWDRYDDLHDVVLPDPEDADEAREFVRSMYRTEADR